MAIPVAGVAVFDFVNLVENRSCYDAAGHMVGFASLFLPIIRLDDDDATVVR